MKHKSRLFIPSKKDYIKGERPKVDCILCSVVAKDERVSSLDIYTGEHFIISANLYPYNAGHVMIFPKRHIETIEDFTQDEAKESHYLQVIVLKALRELYAPLGFNVGYNIGDSSGASIAHVHLHVVPRYHREVGFLDVLGGARIIIEDPNDTVKKLSKTINELILASKQPEG